MSENASREAMQMALDMLNEIADDVYCDQKLEGVITALRQALVDVDDTSQKRVDETAKREHEWVGLTDEEVVAATNTVHGFGAIKQRDMNFARAIEAKLKENNCGH